MNYVSIMKLIRFCERETPAQLLLEYAINEAIIAEREACAMVAEGGVFLHDEAPDARFGKACAKAIRARGEQK